MLEIIKLAVKWRLQEASVVAEFYENLCLPLAHRAVQVSTRGDVGTVTPW